MMAGVLDVEMQSPTSSLIQSQSSDHAANDALHQRESRKMRRIQLFIGSFILEGLSIAIDQLSTPKKPIYAIMSMITASLGLLLSIIELFYRARENDMIFSLLLGEALENFGFFISIWQCVYAVVQYVYHYKKKINNPIKISILPLIFLICVAISKLYQNYCQRRPYITIVSSVDASRTTTSSRVESSVSWNARAIEEIDSVGENDSGVLITPIELRNDTTVHQRHRRNKRRQRHKRNRLNRLNRRHRLRKRRWTPEEDQKLVAYVTRYGAWNWRDLPKFAGLSRSGKSCRSRWINYLRPNVQEGDFTIEEDEIIISAHEKVGNKWSAIAAQLPGRTDNGIKNYWHSNLKKRVKEQKTITLDDETSRAQQPNIHDDSPNLATPGIGDSIPSSSSGSPTSEVSSVVTADTANVTSEDLSHKMSKTYLD